MLVDGIQLIGASMAVNFSVNRGVNLPVSGNEGELFFQSGVGLRVYDGTTWILVKGDTGVGVAGIQGEPGIQGIQGLPGNDGADGAQGIQGAPGPTDQAVLAAARLTAAYNFGAF